MKSMQHGTTTSAKPTLQMDGHVSNARQRTPMMVKNVSGISIEERKTRVTRITGGTRTTLNGKRLDGISCWKIVLVKDRAEEVWEARRLGS